jgi:hypothetical protein
MAQTIDDDVLRSLDRLAFVALLERLPTQADELRARRKKLLHEAWREANKERVADFNRAYIDKLPKKERQRRWKKAAKKHRAKKKKETLEQAMVAVRIEMKGTRGHDRALLQARLDEYLAALGRLDVE